jgi:hypothetical protein
MGTKNTLARQYGPLVWSTYWELYFRVLGTAFLGIQMNVLKPLRLLGRNGGGTTMESVSAYAANFMRKHARLAPYASRLERNPDVANLMVA